MTLGAICFSGSVQNLHVLSCNSNQGKIMDVEMFLFFISFTAT